MVAKTLEEAGLTFVSGVKMNTRRSGSESRCHSAGQTLQYSLRQAQWKEATLLMDCTIIMYLYNGNVPAAAALCILSGRSPLQTTVCVLDLRMCITFLCEYDIIRCGFAALRYFATWRDQLSSWFNTVSWQFRNY